MASGYSKSMNRLRVALLALGAIACGDPTGPPLLIDASALEISVEASATTVSLASSEDSILVRVRAFNPLPFAVTVADQPDAGAPAHVWWTAGIVPLDPDPAARVHSVNGGGALTLGPGEGRTVVVRIDVHDPLSPLHPGEYRVLGGLEGARAPSRRLHVTP